MKLNKPKGTLTQPFGVNYNASYKESGLIGHTGEDYVIGWKKPIQAVVDGEVYSTINLNNKNPDKYRAIYQIVDDGDFSYEVSYGHIDTSFVEKGDFVKAGQDIATEGNYGLCYQNGQLVTPEQKLLGIGSHLHFQVRKCKRVEKREQGKKYLRDSATYLKRKGMFYEVVDYDNGYNGCVSPTPFYNQISFQGVLNLIAWMKKMGFIK